jgi:homoserine dehydrogenase
LGYGLYQFLEKTPALNARISRICVKDHAKQRPAIPVTYTFAKGDILNDESINIVVELIDDADAAFEIVKAALRKGKSVVSANKKMIAEHLEELLDLQREHNAALLYEGACCASIPIIRNLEEYYYNDLLESIEGIVNGSTNYILTKTKTENISFQEALRQAQQKGYAESDPVLDVEGYDAKYKLVLLIAHAFGLVVKPEDIFNIGIDRLEEPEFTYAREKDLKIKLVANAYKTFDGKVCGFVLPKFVSARDKLFSVDDVFNGVKTQSVFSDSQFFVGKGAGAFPTASAVLSDISALTYDYRYEYKKLGAEIQLEDAGEIFLKAMIRLKAGTSQIRHYFLEVEEERRSRTGDYTIGTITLAKVQELCKKYGSGGISVVLLENSEGRNNADLKLLSATDWR